MSLLIDEKLDLTLQEWTSYAVLLGEDLNTLRAKTIFWASRKNSQNRSGHHLLEQSVYSGQH